jgi:hypothetical protein
MDSVKQHVPVVIQWAERLALFEARLAAPSNFELIIAQSDGFTLHIATHQQVANKLNDGIVRVLLTSASNDCGTFFIILLLISCSGLQRAEPHILAEEEAAASAPQQ